MVQTETESGLLCSEFGLSRACLCTFVKIHLHSSLITHFMLFLDEEQSM